VARISRTQALACLAVATLAAGAVSTAADDPVVARHHAMEGVGDAMKALGAMAQQKAPFDAAVVKKNAGVIAENLKSASTLFPPGSQTSPAMKSRAKAEIWAEGSDFQKLLKEGQDAAAALQQVADPAALGPAVKALGGSCKSCHDKYRLPEQ
jgi:cytochrome c556